MLDLQVFDQSAAPASNGGRLELKDLADGDYEFAIRKAHLKITKKQSTPILSMDIEVLTQGPREGAVVERASFLTSQDAFNWLLSDLMKLGFDADQWKASNNRPASAEVEKAVKLLPGLRFKGKKVTNGTYHNVYINERSNDDGRPARFGADELNAVPKDPF